MEITVVTNGNIDDENILRSVLSSSDYVICADGAAKYFMDINVKPDLLVGDLDSIDASTLEWVKKSKIDIKQFPVKKDMTDTELAIEYAINMSPNVITLIGAIGSRMDHSLANIMLLYKIHKVGIRARIVNEVNDIAITDCTLHIDGRIGQTISIIPIGGDAKGVSLIGLEYKLLDQDIALGSSLGISNMFREERAIITVDKGTLLVIKVHSDTE